MRRGYQAARRGHAARAGMMGPMAETGASGGYRALLRVPGYPALISAVALSRLANSMSQVGVVIYLLEATRSPAIAGAGAAAQLLPGILTGPFVGAWLDRTHARVRGIVATQLLRATLLFAVIACGQLLHAPAAVLLLLLGGLGATFPIPTVGFRSLIPVAVPRPLWHQANAADSISFDSAFVIGPALAGATVTLVGAPWAIGLQAVATLVAGAVASRVREPGGRVIETEPPLEAVVAGLRAVVSHTQLRATMALMVVSGLGYGCFIIGLPLWARGTLHMSAGVAGWMWAAASVGSVIGGLVYGWRPPPGTPARHVVVFTALFGLPLLLVPLVSSLWLGIACMFVSGLCSAPFIIAMFSIRQGAVDTRLHGRIFAITVSVNAAGTPVGAFLAGLLVTHIGVHRLLFGAGLGQLLAAAVAGFLLRRGDDVPALGLAEPEQAAA
jgi:MFS family permease